MMVRIIMFFVVILLASVCLAQDQQSYHNERGHFSLTPPEDWKVVPVGQLSERYRALLKSLYLDHIVAVMTLENEHEDSVFPCIIIQAMVSKATKNWATIEQRFINDEIGVKGITEYYNTPQKLGA